jgi:hypothetical protein
MSSAFATEQVQRHSSPVLSYVMTIPTSPAAAPELQPNHDEILDESPETETD